MRDFKSVYSGLFLLDPRRFSPQWFHKAAQRHVKAGKWGEGMKMELDDGTWWDSPLYLSIEYLPFGNEKAPSVEESEALLKRMLNVLAGNLKE